MSNYFNLSFFLFATTLLFVPSYVLANTKETAENQYVLHDQRYPGIAQLNSSRVIVWQSDRNGNGKWDIYARYNDAKEIRVNTNTGGTHTNPSVAMFSPTDAFVVFQSLNEDGNGWGIYGSHIQIIRGKNGQVSLSSSPDFKINDYTNSNQMNPNVACSLFCVVVWQSLNQDGSGYGVYAKQFRFNGARQLLPAGFEFRVNTATDNNQQNPRVAFFPNESRYVVVWDYVPDGDGSGIRFKISTDFFQVTQSNQILPGNDFSANQRTAGNQLRPAATVLLNRQIVIAWKSQQGANIIVARLFDSDGRPVTNDFTVATVAGTNLGYLSVASLSKGSVGSGAGWAVVWQAQNGIYLRSYNAAQKLSSTKVNQVSAGIQPATPAIAGSSAGIDTVVTWESSTIDGSGYGISIREFDI